ncbi:MAG: leucine-rich repeat domain-containing protein [Bacilli bacterium]|nr:leucine-rich repeat domain-containing protein [Bacilli bacterium]
MAHKHTLCSLLPFLLFGVSCSASHQHIADEITYEWSNDHLFCTATLSCRECGEPIASETVEANLTIKTNATETTAGCGYATASFEDSRFQSQTITFTIDALGSLDKLSFVSNGEGYLVQPNSKDIEGDVFIPRTFEGQTVHAIPEKAFAHCESITSVVLLDSLKTIGEDAFAFCSSLKTAAMPAEIAGSYGAPFQTVKLTGSGKVRRAAFSRCSKLEAVELDPNITGIEERAFENCSSLKTLSFSEKLTQIGDHSFAGCVALSALPVPETVEIVGLEAFDGCVLIPRSEYKGGQYLGTNRNPYLLLEKVLDKTVDAFEIHDNCRVILPYALFCCDCLKSVSIPDAIHSIGNGAFGRCGGLKSITFGANLKHIGAYAFERCRVNSLSLPESLLEIGDYAFSQSQISEIKFGKAITRLGTNSFYGCMRLRSVYLPDSITHIDSGAFALCTTLATVSLGNGLTVLGNGVFSECSSLEFNSFRGVRFLGNKNNPFLALIDAKYADSSNVVVPNNCKLIAEKAFASTDVAAISLPSSIRFIGSRAFMKCAQLTSLQVPDSVSYIGEMAFEGCTGLSQLDIPATVAKNYGAPKLTSLTIRGNGGIAPHAFYGAPSLERLTISKGVTDLGACAFSQCPHLSTVVLGGDIRSIGSQSFSNCSSLDSIEIGKKVDVIGRGAFAECKSLKTVLLKQGLRTIEEFAFSNCVSLEKINLPNSLKTIGCRAFNHCESLQSIAIPGSVVSLSDYTFEGCLKLSTVSLEEGLRSIGHGVFFACASLTAIAIPNSVLIMGTDVFDGCVSLREVSVGNGLRSLGSRCFDLPSILYNEANDCSFVGNKSNPYLILVKTNDSSLKTLEIPSSCRIIQSSAFEWSDLESIALQENIVDIGEYSFSRCSKLVSAIIYSSIAVLRHGLFNQCSSLTSVVIPTEVGEIQSSVFKDCNNLTSIFFAGREASWQNVEVGEKNEPLNHATIYFFSETKPTSSGHFWHYINDIPTPW